MKDSMKALCTDIEAAGEKGACAHSAEVWPNQHKPMTHELKCWPEFFEAVNCGDKPFEIRKWDRPFRIGDVLWLHEWDSRKGSYTGRSVKRKITYLLDLGNLPGDTAPCYAGYVAIGLGMDA